MVKKIYFSVAIGGTNTVEYATGEIFSKFATDGVKSLPFIDKILTSITDGFVNAALLTRISLITENYCKMTYVESKKDLYPSAAFILTTTKTLTSKLIESLFQTMVKDNIQNFTSYAASPVRYLWNQVKDINETLINVNTSIFSSTLDAISSGIKSIVN